jgi:uncharacterized protein
MKLQVAAIALLLGSALPASAQPPGPPPPAVIVTTGDAVVKQAPDRAWVTIGTESRGKSPQETQSQNSTVMTNVIQRIKDSGVPADAIQTSSYTLQPEFDYANGKQSLRGYVARNQVLVRVDALATTGDVIAAVVGTGATSVQGVRFDVKDRAKLERQALTQAVRDARGRADAIATGAGVQIDRVVRIEESRENDVIQPMAMRMNAMAEMAKAAPPIEAGEIEIRSRVTLTAAIR